MSRHPDSPIALERHPKRYLSYLSPDYRETADGVAALSALSWQSVGATGAAYVRFARSLFEDLSFIAEPAVEKPLGVGQPHPVTYDVETSAAHRVLRNF